MSHVISTRDLEVSFSSCDALRGIDLRVSPGSVFALLGENGAGKTTLIRVLTGFLHPSKGECSVLGMNPVREAQAIRMRVGYVSDAPALYDWMRVAEIGWFAAAFYDEHYLPRYRDAIARYEVPSGRKIKHLSRGQRAKVALALALAHDPELLILDEPTSGLDPLVRREFLESMLDRVATGRTVLLSSHQIAEVERVADEVAILHQGRFQIVETLSDLRDAVSVVTITLDDPLVTLPDLDSSITVMQEQAEGRQRRLVARNFTTQAADKLEAHARILSVRARPATLDEIFAACTRGISTLSNAMQQEASDRKPAYNSSSDSAGSSVVDVA